MENKEVERLEKELLEVLKKNYGQCKTDNVNGNVYIYIENYTRLYEIINYDDVELNEYEKLDSILMCVCNNYNYDYEVLDDYTILVYKK